MSDQFQFNQAGKFFGCMIRTEWGFLFKEPSIENVFDSMMPVDSRDFNWWLIKNNNCIWWSCFFNKRRMFQKVFLWSYVKICFQFFIVTVIMLDDRQPKESTCKMPNETWNEIYRNEIYQNETKRNEMKQNGTE